MKSRDELTAEQLREILDYDPETGVFTWRPRSHPREWNSRRAGKEAGCIYNSGYRCIRINGIVFLAHRLAWLLITGSWPEEEIDHINGITDDNRANNLRPATHAQNSRNRRVTQENPSGFRGVKCRDYGVFEARIKANGQDHYLGCFSTAEEAHAAYCEASKDLHGDFGRTE